MKKPIYKRFYLFFNVYYAHTCTPNIYSTDGRQLTDPGASAECLSKQTSM